MASVREERINNEMKREMSTLLKDLKDPRIPEIISVVKADVTRDLKYAKIYVSLMGSEKDKNGALAGLNSASPYLRREIGQRIKLRTVPELTFIIDDSIEYGAHIQSILDDLNKGKN